MVAVEGDKRVLEETNLLDLIQSVALLLERVEGDDQRGGKLVGGIAGQGLAIASTHLGGGDLVTWACGA